MTILLKVLGIFLLWISVGLFMGFCLYGCNLKKMLRMQFGIDLWPNRAENDPLFNTGYWGWEITRKYAWLPVETSDFGRIWFRRYYNFQTNTGYDKHSWTWEIQDRTVTESKMMESKERFLRKVDANFDRKSRGPVAMNQRKKIVMEALGFKTEAELEEYLK